MSGQQFEWNFAGVAQGHADELSAAKRIVATWARGNPHLIEKAPSTVTSTAPWAPAVWRLVVTRRAGQLVLSWKEPHQ